MSRIVQTWQIESYLYPANPSQGRVRWSPVKSLWISIMYVGAIAGGSLNFSWDALLLFIATSGITLCAGHSVGMHRRLIHNSFQCPLWLEHILVYLGCLVGLAGPFSIIQMHELRDWAQRQPSCHDYFASRQPVYTDIFWLLCGEIKLKYPPALLYEPKLRQDRFYQLLEKSWRWQQIPWAILFYYLGGWSWVFWGICVRVSVCVTGHWWIGYLAHRSGDRDWRIEGAGVQGYNLKFWGLLTMGECWHNNHHAFPDSAKFGLSRSQNDPGWWLIQIFKRLGLAWNIKTPLDLPPRPELVAVSDSK